MQILLAVDELDSAEHLASFVVNHHWAAEASFFIMHVITPLPIASALPSDLLDAINEERWIEGRQIVRHAALRIRDAFKTVHVYEEVMAGDAKETILDKAEELGCDVILLSSHGRQGLERLVIGSVSQAVFANAKCSVIIVRPAARTAATKTALKEGSGTMKILIAIDDSFYSQWVVDTIVKRHWPANSEFKVVSVVEPLKESDSDKDLSIPIKQAQSKRRLHAEQLCQKALRKIEQYIPDSIVQFEIKVGDPADEIVALANEWRANKILLGAHSKDVCPHNLLGSVSLKVTNHAFCSVEIVKPQATVGIARR